MGTSTQTQHPARAVIRTAVQLVVGLAALLPFALDAVSNGDPASLGGGAVIALSVSAAITRVMALPQVEAFLARFAPWLAAGGSQDG